MKILFLVLSTLKFDVSSPEKQPLGGTESAVCYLARSLAKRGHDVTLCCNTDAKGDVLGVHHIDKNAHGALADVFDVTIVPSAAYAFPELRQCSKGSLLVLWNHMLPNQPALKPLFEKNVQECIDHIVYVSERQKGTFNVPVKSSVINNAVSPAFLGLFSSAEEILKTKECKGVYTSTPFRGLSILAKIEELPIDVYSSMKVYQMEDDAYLSIYKELSKNSCLDLKGSVSQSELAKNERSAAFMVYPCIFGECDCIAIKEAMAAGVEVVTTENALPLDDKWASVLSLENASLEGYTALLRKKINAFRSDPKGWAERMWKQVQEFNETCTWDKRAEEWEELLKRELGKTISNPERKEA